MALDPITAGMEVGGKLLDLIKRWIPDPAEAAKAQQGILELFAQSDKNQTEINKIEAASNNLFVSGWRPGIGWICGAGYAYAFVLQPFLIFIFTIAQVPIKTEQLPVLDMGEMGLMLANLLGFGALRTYEKVKVNGK